jgi:leader peptidase (prepilin peptidase) / N-methyltransferase
MFDPATWGAVPFHFWSVVFFVFGCIVGSLLNVCIHRMPRGESIVTPGSHCPHCGYSIPWYLNIPLITWLYLRGKCANCGAGISVRYFLVELFTGTVFLGCWLFYGAQSPAMALVYCLFLASLIVATFIDFEHLIIPDEITIGGIVVGFIASALVPELHAHLFTGALPSRAEALKLSFWGIAAGGGIIYTIVRLGKLAFGRQRISFESGARIVFTETCLRLPDMEIPYEEIFYRKSDVVRFVATTVELPDRCYFRTLVRLTPERLEIGDESFSPEEIGQMEAVTDEIVLPREAMGLGDVKFMAAIGAVLGWQAVLFSLMLSSLLGSIAGGVMIALKKLGKTNRIIPYGPYIALAATLWIFGGKQLVAWWFR